MPEVTWPLIQLNRIVQPGPTGPWLCDMQGCRQWAEYAVSSPAFPISQEAYLPNSCARHLGPLVAKTVHLITEAEERLERDIPLRVIHVLGDDEP